MESDTIEHKRSELGEKGDRDDADALMQLVVPANQSVFDSIKGDPNMCEALMELMKDEFEERVEREVTARVEREATTRNAEFVKVLMDRFGLGREEAMDAIKIPARERAGVIALL